MPETVIALRRQLMTSSAAHQKIADQYMAAWQERNDSDTELDDHGKAIGAALHGHVMAASLSYTLAAVLRLVQSWADPATAIDLANEIDELLTNGDFEDINGDLTDATPADDPSAN